MQPTFMALQHAADPYGVQFTLKPREIDVRKTYETTFQGGRDVGLSNLDCGCLSFITLL